MSFHATADGRRIRYRIDDCTDPWTRPPAILLLHGLAESHRVWFAWVPWLARTFRLVRPDLPGFGESTPLQPGQAFSLDAVADDLLALLASVGLDQVHVIGQRAGGTVALHLALRHPHVVRSLTLVSAPVRLSQARGGPGQPSWREQFQAEGLPAQIRRTMAGRFGDAPGAQVEWWIGEMARTSLDSMMAAAAALETLDLGPRLHEVRAPTLLVTADRGTLVPLRDMVEAAERIPGARLMVLPRDSYHLAATEPDLCAREALRFIRSVATETRASP